MEIHISIAAETLFMLGPIPVTNSMLTMFIVMAILLIGGAAIARGAKQVPGRWQSIFEVGAEFILNLVESTGGKSFGRQLFPMVGAMFVFIAIANYTGVLPGVGTIGIYHTEEAAAGAEHDEAGPPEETETAVVESEPGEVAVTEDAHEEEAHQVLVPLFRAPNADLNMTLAMALVTFTTVQILGIRRHGVIGRIKHMADPPFLFPIEVVSELGRIISLSARLFGNVFAGEVLLAVMYALANAVRIAVVPLLVPVVFIGLELLFGTIQALVFALLTAIYITMAAGDDGHGEHADHAAGDHHAPEPNAPARVPVGAGD
jgi:F-type H+-transporting ATPase subunit a